jgi:hypothetical protein
MMDQAVKWPFPTHENAVGSTFINPGEGAVEAKFPPAPEWKLVDAGAFLKPETMFFGGINEVILRVSHEGVFTWHENADAMIEDMDKRGGQGATVAILKRLRASEKGEEHF